MARAPAKRGGRSRSNARARGREQRVATPTPKKKKAPSYEDQLFFTRLRRHQRWVFLFLALAFFLGFVVLGIGSGNGFLADAISDIGGGGSSSIQSVEEAQKKVDQSPNDPKALLALASALQADAKPEKAIDVLERYRALQPADTDALQQLAALYDVEASRAQRDASQLEAQAFAGSFTSAAFLFPGSSGFLGALGNDPIDRAVTDSVSVRAEEARNKLTGVFEKQLPVLQKLVELTPDEPLLYLRLADAALSTNQNPVALDAYETFLEIAPDDPNASEVRRRLASLRGTSDVVTG